MEPSLVAPGNDRDITCHGSVRQDPGRGVPPRHSRGSRDVWKHPDSSSQRDDHLRLPLSNQVTLTETSAEASGEPVRSGIENRYSPGGRVEPTRRLCHSILYIVNGFFVPVKQPMRCEPYPNTKRESALGRFALKSLIFKVSWLRCELRFGAPLSGASSQTETESPDVPILSFCLLLVSSFIVGRWTHGECVRTGNSG